MEKIEREIKDKKENETEEKKMKKEKQSRKSRRKKSLRKSFIYEVLCTVIIVVILSGATILGCVLFQNWLLPDSKEVFLNITKEYDDGSVQQSSMRLAFGEEDIESFLVEKKDDKEKENKTILKGEGILVEKETDKDGRYIFKIQAEDINGENLREGERSQKEIADSEPIQKNVKYSVDKIENSYNALSPKRKAAYTTASVAMVGLPLIYSIIGILICGFWFYKKKLDKPIRILLEATDNIANQDLDFNIYYSEENEMGALCESFEEMRKALHDNNKKLWSTLEESRMLQASVAHDLRNPIAIIEGYTEYLQMNLSQGEISREKLEGIVCNLSESAKRLERYTDSIRDIHKLEELEITPEKCNLEKLFDEISDDFTVMAKTNNRKVKISRDVQKKEVLIDKQIFSRILENIFTNSLRFAKESIQINFSEKDNRLITIITDDGMGFDKKVLEKRNRYMLTTDKSGKHMGMGLVISSILAKKHGGEIELKNNEKNGAVVKVIIKIF